MSQDPKIFKKLVQWIKSQWSDYEFQMGDFRLEQDTEGIVLKEWDLELEVPDLLEIEKIELVKEDKSSIIRKIMDLQLQLDQLKAKLDESL